MNKIIPTVGIFSWLFFCAAVMWAEDTAVESAEQPAAEKSEQPVRESTEQSLFESTKQPVAENTDQPAAEKPEPPNETEILQWIKQLDSESFEERETAVTELTKAGLPAVLHVMKAAQSESLEASTRAFDVLDKWITGEDQIAKVGAKGVLEKLSAGEESSKAVRRAKALLAKSTASQSPAYAEPGGRRIIAGAMPLRVGVAPARVELRAMAKMAVGVRGRSMRMTIANGKKTIQVAEGENLEVQIVEDDDKGIQIKVTEKGKDGKATTSDYAAKNLEELKEKHPEGHKVYEKYAAALNGIKVRMEAAKARAVPEPVKKPVEEEAPAE